MVDDSALVTRHREIAAESELVFARVYGEFGEQGSFGQGGFLSASPRDAGRGGETDDG